MHKYFPTSSSYSAHPSFCMAFVNSNHYVVLHFKKVNRSIPAPPIDGWWLRKSSSRNKNVWLQSLEIDLNNRPINFFEVENNIVVRINKGHAKGRVS
ncbi:hypothetical protein PPACK8108_LOCUS6012 [Phakopsora pachyrhizi]|uniref:Uncharacterized protein n=1 Tax=Phakopsora pachyrhizi TaxID=170000 RepID=A0AAV0AS21_PHAPC|nr:hypothetical protein PPACK8108_LOCUS6012 [Phakopsora pachyrhizi]